MSAVKKKSDWLFAGCCKRQAQQCFLLELVDLTRRCGRRGMRSVMEASLLLYLRIIACP
jgi:hypothetical protein